MFLSCWITVQPIILLIYWNWKMGKLELCFCYSVPLHWFSLCIKASFGSPEPTITVSIWIGVQNIWSLTTTNVNPWAKYTGKEYITRDETQLIALSKQDMKAACVTFITNVELGDMTAWIKVDMETPVVQHLDEEDMAASVKKMGRQLMNL
jgi:hypothetical protein